MVELIQVPLLKDNYAYVLHDSQSGATAVVDPAEAGPVLEVLHHHRWDLTHILCTHHHYDHVEGVPDLKIRYPGAQVLASAQDGQKISSLDHGLHDNENFLIGDLKCVALVTPGHTLGHVCFWLPDQAMLFSGDTLFTLGCGRLFEGSPLQMWQSLSRLAALPDETLVYCAHEYTQSNGRFARTIEPDNPRLLSRLDLVDQLRAQGLPTVPAPLMMERDTNPFLRAGNAENFTRIRQAKDHF